MPSLADFVPTLPWLHSLASFIPFHVHSFPSMSFPFLPCPFSSATFPSFLCVYDKSVNVVEKFYRACLRINNCRAFEALFLGDFCLMRFFLLPGMGCNYSASIGCRGWFSSIRINIASWLGPVSAQLILVIAMIIQYIMYFVNSPSISFIWYIPKFTI